MSSTIRSSSRPRLASRSWSARGPRSLSESAPACLETGSALQEDRSVLLMGFAVAGMHYTGMAAAQFTGGPAGWRPTGYFRFRVVPARTDSRHLERRSPGDRSPCHTVRSLDQHDEQQVRESARSRPPGCLVRPTGRTHHLQQSVLVRVHRPLRERDTRLRVDHRNSSGRPRARRRQPAKRG